MISKVATLIIILLLFFFNQANAIPLANKTTCNSERFTCYKVKPGDTWEKLFGNEDQIDLIKRLNRTNMRLRPGQVIAIPDQLESLDIADVSPFPARIRPPGEKEVIVDLNKLAWAAYDAQGYLIHWGPASGGQGYCPDVNRTCRTITGNFRVQEKQPAGCVSNVYPLETDGGAPMPFCMHFWRGFALHGSYEVPGYNASHGCVRMFINDARWLNEQFLDVGTKVIVREYQ